MTGCRGFSVLVACFLVASVAPASDPDGTGPFLGQPLPGLESTIFAPEVVSLQESLELNAVFSPDGRIFLFSRKVGDALKVFQGEQLPDGAWAAPTMAEFSRTNTEWDEVDNMWFTSDGSGLFYISNAPVSKFAPASVNIWHF